MNDQYDKLLDHDYDGIKELDNDLPRWWVWLFYITIVFGVLYMLYYHVLDVGFSSADQYRSEVDPTFVRQQDIVQPSYLGVLPKYMSPLAQREADKRTFEKTKFVMLTHETDTTTYVAATGPVALAEGQEIFQVRCASCHGAQGQGGVGPNLTDNYWLHGAEFSNIVKTVRYGFPTKGMISWLGHLTPGQIIHVATFVQTLHGTNPPNPKAPEGELVSQESK